MKVIISGGGTGGHIFPAISIANALKETDPQVDILFVGAQGKMEMEKVPSAGYRIEGLPVAGFQRRITLKNLSFGFKLIASLMKARKIVRRFRPDVVVGVGGYASGPVLRVASKVGIPCLIQEQNSFPGVTNRILSKKVEKICVAYDGMDLFFPKDKIILTGNPVRQGLKNEGEREEAMSYFQLKEDKKTILIVGGSLGARSINHGIINGLKDLDEDVQVVWQTGKFYYEEIKNKIGNKYEGRVMIYDFLSRMDLAFRVADLVVSRAGASSISELALLSKPVIFVPSPNVAEDHQTKNAMALVNKEAALLVKDSDVSKLVGIACETVKKEDLLASIAKHIKQFARPDAASDIANEIFKLKGK
ncbi:undecaprenyldiphospho-muramoylpentapeptide beta-N-acetylglucosaminyltransferase [Marinilabiliaceae bacterium JC017]|nr:undecaprenyldiphospho-muramoylpentapeptide beta-N-acetylglucosaminyltransferase [Marinilabiliaceae bacterium JC017]